MNRVINSESSPASKRSNKEQNDLEQQLADARRLCEQKDAEIQKLKDVSAKQNKQTKKKTNKKRRL